jgi:threonine dehydratase
MTAPPIPSLDEIRVAKERIAGFAIRSPLVRLEAAQRTGAPAGIHLKLENLQPGGSFKVRGAGNALQLLDRSQRTEGVWTASAGNMGQALAWWARALEIPCTVLVPDNAAPVKMQAIAALGARILPVPFDDYQRVQRERRHPAMAGRLVHPFADLAVMAGNGTIGLEILEDLPDVQAVVVPYGGGGLSCGIAAAVKAVRPEIKVWAAEVETGAPFAASFAAGRPVEVPYRHSFVNGMGAPFVFAETWALSSRLLDGSIVVSLEQVAEAIRLIAARTLMLAEGAGAVAAAAALTGRAGTGKVVGIVSGGNIDAGQVTAILAGRVPT